MREQKMEQKNRINSSLVDVLTGSVQSCSIITKTSEYSSMQILSWLPTSLAAALAAATLVSTLTSLFGRARLQRSCANYRDEIGAGTPATKEVAEALRLKWLAQLVARDTYPARWTLFKTHSCVLFGMLLSVMFGHLVATQDPEAQGEVSFFAPVLLLLIIPAYSTSRYLIVAMKRTDIRREVAERAAGKTIDDAQEVEAASNGEVFRLCVGATIPNVVSFLISFVIALDGSSFSGPTWVVWSMSIVFMVAVIFGGSSLWFYLPRLSDKLEAWAVEPIVNLPKRPNERDDQRTKMEERVKAAARTDQEKREPEKSARQKQSFILRRGR